MTGYSSFDCHNMHQTSKVVISTRRDNGHIARIDKEEYIADVSQGTVKLHRCSLTSLTNTLSAQHGMAHILRTYETAWSIVQSSERHRLPVGNLASVYTHPPMAFMVLMKKVVVAGTAGGAGEDKSSLTGSKASTTPRRHPDGRRD